MKTKSEMVTIKSESEAYSKQNVKMAINRTIGQKRGFQDRLGRNTVLVNNLTNQRNVITNVRAVMTNNNNNVDSNNKNINSELLRCKRKIQFIPGQTYPSPQPASVARRNARERNRVKQVNNGFATLRSHIPPSVAAALTSEKASSRNSSANKKLSKVETLKMAVEYIRSLQQMLEDHNNSMEKKAEQAGYENRYEMEENYYSSSPDSSTQTIGCVPAEMVQKYPESPNRIYMKSEPESVYPKTEPVEEYYPSRRDDVYIKSEDVYRSKFQENFNQEIHNTLTSEFYQARSPVKSYYGSPERSPEYKHPGLHLVPSEVGVVDQDVSSPGKEYRHYDRSPESGLTVLNTVSEAQVVHFAGHSFAQPRVHHRNSTSLSPTASDACPSPTPSYSSDHSSIHPSSIVSSSSGHLVTKLSRLSTGMMPPEQLSSPLARSVSPMGTPSSPAAHSNYSGGIEFQKDSPSEAYDAYEPVSPEDEELLDVISWWQQSH